MEIVDTEWWGSNYAVPWYLLSIGINTRQTASWLPDHYYRGLYPNIFGQLNYFCCCSGRCSRRPSPRGGSGGRRIVTGGTPWRAGRRSTATRAPQLGRIKTGRPPPIIKTDTGALAALKPWSYDVLCLWALIESAIYCADFIAKANCKQRTINRLRNFLFPKAITTHLYI